MSSYEYHEFQAVDRPLTDEEQRAVAQLSSRVNPHPWQAVFVYHWSSFRGNAHEILARILRRYALHNELGQPAAHVSFSQGRPGPCSR